jgi:type VI secretion system protein ImpH
MDAEVGHAAGHLTIEDAELLAEARRAGFRALMLVADRLRPGSASALGGAASPHEEAIRLRHDPSLAFPLADVESVRIVTIPAEAGTTGLPREVLQITTSFLGLTGSVSPLPPHMAEEVAQEVAEQRGEPRTAAFLDLFHHRALSFFHRAGAKHDVPAGALSDQSDDWSRRLFALLGRDEPRTDAPAPADPDAEPRWRALRYAPFLAERALTAAALEACLADLLAPDLHGGRVVVEQFVGSWVELAPDERTRVGRSATELGRSFVLGARVFDRAGKIRVVIGPLDADGYTRFAAPERVAAIRRAVRSLAGDDLDLELALRLAPRAAPGFVLSSDGRHRLGRNTWLGHQKQETQVIVDSGAGSGPSAAAA